MKLPILIFLMVVFAMMILAITRRRHFLSGILVGLFSVIIGVLILYLPLDEALNIFGFSLRFDGRWQLLGRTFLLNQNNRAAIGYIFFAGGFILAGAWTAKPVRLYFSLSMGVLGVIAAALMIEPFLFAAIFIELAVIGSSLILTSREPGRSRGGLRLLSFYTLAMLAILFVGWSIDLSEANINFEGMNLTLQLLLGFGFSILISVPPFHAWIPIAAKENHPFSWSVVAVVLHGAALFFILRFITSFSWLYENEMLFPFIRDVGATIALLGAVWSLLQKDLLKMAGYALISDIGVMLIALGLGNQEGFQLALGLSGARVISLACISIGLIQVWKIRKEMEAEMHSKPLVPSTLASAAILVGILSLAGFPLTAGFPGRWGLLSNVAPLDQFAWIAIMGSMGFLSIAVIRSANILITHSPDTHYEIKDWKERAYIGVGILLTIILGIFPQLLFPWIIRALEGITLPI